MCFCYLCVSTSPCGPISSQWTLTPQLLMGEQGPCPLGEPSQASLGGPPAHPPLLLLLWTWAFNTPQLCPSAQNRGLAQLTATWPSTAACTLGWTQPSCIPERLATDRRRSFCHPWGRPASAASGLTRHRPAATHTEGLYEYFNLTMSFHRDWDITWHGWLEPWPGQPLDAPVNLSANMELVAWVVSAGRRIRPDA